MVSQTEYKRKFLVVIDETPECERALTFAAYRVKRTGGTVVLMDAGKGGHGRFGLRSRNAQYGQARWTTHLLPRLRILSRQ